MPLVCLYCACARLKNTAEKFGTHGQQKLRHTQNVLVECEFRPKEQTPKVPWHGLQNWSPRDSYHQQQKSVAAVVVIFSVYNIIIIVVIRVI